MTGRLRRRGFEGQGGFESTTAGLKARDPFDRPTTEALPAGIGHGFSIDQPSPDNLLRKQGGRLAGAPLVRPRSCRWAWATDGGAPGHLGHTACRTRGTRRSPTSRRPSGRQCTTTNLAVNGVLTRGQLERPAGIEPALSPWKGDVPPQHFGRSRLQPASLFHSAVAPRQVGA